MIGRLGRALRFELKKLVGRQTILVPQAFYARRGPIVRRLLAPPFFLVAFTAIVATAILSGYGEEVAEKFKSVTGGERDAFKNAWSTLAGAASRSNLIGLLVVLVLSGMSLAEESQLGTLKSILIRPVRRGELVWAKAFSLGLFVLALSLVVAGGSLGVGAAFFQFGDVVDPEYGTVQISAGEMAWATALAFALTIPPLLAAVGFGMLVSTVLDQPGYAVGGAIGGLALLHFTAAVSKTLAPYLFVSWIAWPLDTLRDMGLSFSEAAFNPADIAHSLVVCLGTGLICVALSAWRLGARDVGE